jgi:hypothetical protein
VVEPDVTVTEVPDNVLDSGKVDAVMGAAGPRDDPDITISDPWATFALKSAALPAE